MTPARAEIVVDLAAIRHNVRVLRATTGVEVIVVVKADGYGHGMAEVAGAARAAGATWLAVATLDEALRLRAAGDTGRLLCWLTVPGEPYADALRAGIDVTAYSVAELDEIAAASAHAGAGLTARVQLKVDTGLSRGGAPREAWGELFARARAGEEAGLWQVTGLWSHFACSDEPAHPANDQQEQAFRDALALADGAGLHPELRHLANSAAAILRPSARFDAVRCGIASYGLDPAPGHTPDLGLVPAMTVRARIALVKALVPGDSVSYGHTWTAPTPTTVGLVPAGYGEGVPRHASGVASVGVGGAQRPIRGRVCMDQFLVDLGPGDDSTPQAGDEVLLFGPGHHGEPTAQDWAEACDTISYEIVTRIGGRMTRTHVDTDPATRGEPATRGKPR
ncbi:alanine racemase [Nocardioides psychrotolerans]|uniref:Alanine racemase n=1 Tax=Nocardioides psychrotolerans TaxID=1005945 RepID=A0A1I3BJC0_9ACTN|nr:alanine racemase [Nocardioides psychrotolerans]GEP36605.1 alanine racemase [Nocardioides psychrotolerans]SFH62387.1 alanine racemase [Nocardioides psychrotolerans]